MCGEYGEQKGRPHYHICLFGLDFQDKTIYRTTKHGFKLYTSPTLEKIWGKGFATIGELNYATAAYTARYIIQKKTNNNNLIDKKYREKIDAETGEIIHKTAEYNHMSLRPGIGSEWLKKYINDIINDGQIVIKSNKTKAPRYYDKFIKKNYPEQYEKIQQIRYEKIIEQPGENYDHRLKAKETVKQAQIQQLIRELE